MAVGQTLGTLIGSAAGSVIPGIGTAVGGAAGGALGGTIEGLIKKKQATDAFPGFTDPNEQARLNEVDQIRKGIRTGSDVATQTAIGAVKQAGETAQTAITRSTGGDVGGTISGLIKSQRGTQQATNEAVAQSQARLPFFENLAQSLKTRTSQRKLELGLLGRAQKSAESAQALKDSGQTLGALVATEGSLPGGEQDLLGKTINKAGDFIGNVASNAGDFFTNLFKKNPADASVANEVSETPLPAPALGGTQTGSGSGIEFTGNPAQSIIDAIGGGGNTGLNMNFAGL